MTLRLYNTLSRTKEEFVPLDANNVRMYVCGPTVYDFAHIGNARPVIVFDVLFRLLRHSVRRGACHLCPQHHGRGRQDQRARGGGISESAFERSDPHCDGAHQRAIPTGCRRRWAACRRRIEPRATENIAAMIAMNERLIAAGHAYAAEGHVLYDVSSKPDYGKLARRSLDEMIAGARVEVAPYKKNPMDFVLWKPSTPEQPGWDSPWGRGRPGWHIECSAMSETLVGRDLRHSWRRHRSRLSASRERNRAERRRAWRPSARARLDAQRLPSGRRREDVEEPGEFRDDPRSTLKNWPLSGRADASIANAADPLSPAD